MNSDAEHLRLLSIFHYAVGGMMALFSCLPILHLAIGIAIVTGVMDDLGNNGEPPPDFFGWIFVIVPLGIIMMGMTMALSVVLAGRKLTQRSAYTYCLVIAGIECMFMPFGTVLGVFTIIVLMRPSVKELFGVADGQLPATSETP
jgi:hypothetical protein